MNARSIFTEETFALAWQNLKNNGHASEWRAAYILYRELSDNSGEIITFPPNNVYTKGYIKALYKKCGFQPYGDRVNCGRKIRNAVTKLKRMIIAAIDANNNIEDA